MTVAFSFKQADDIDGLIQIKHIAGDKARKYGHSWLSIISHYKLTWLAQVKLLVYEAGKSSDQVARKTKLKNEETRATVNFIILLQECSPKMEETLPVGWVECQIARKSYYRRYLQLYSPLPAGIIMRIADNLEGSFEPGDIVEVETRGVWRLARILKSHDTRFLVRRLGTRGPLRIVYQKDVCSPYVHTDGVLFGTSKHIQLRRLCGQD